LRWQTKLQDTPGTKIRFEPFRPGVEFRRGQALDKRQSLTSFGTPSNRERAEVRVQDVQPRSSGPIPLAVENLSYPPVPPWRVIANKHSTRRHEEHGGCTEKDQI